MTKKNHLLRKEIDDDGVDRRGFLKCMQWAGAAVVWSFTGGAPVSRLLAADSKKKWGAEDFTFVQISDAISDSISRQIPTSSARFKRPSIASTISNALPTS